MSSATYLPFGPVGSMSLGNGTSITRSYDARYAMIENKLTSPLVTVAGYTYGYDGVGNITTINDGLDATYNRSFGYDDLNRLTGANTGGSLWGAGAYSYDAMGNVMAANVGSATTGFSYQGTTPKVAVAWRSGLAHTVGYDAAGNETQYFVTRGYSPRNLLATVDDALEGGGTHRLAYGYDGRGIRVSRAESPAGTPGAVATRHSIYSPELQLLEVTNDDAPNVWGKWGVVTLAALPAHDDIVWFGGIAVAQIGPSRPPDPIIYSSVKRPPFTTTAAATDTFYTFTDDLGTPLLQTDATGAVAWRAEYEPYGNIWTMRTGRRNDQLLRFPGQELAMTWEGGEENYNIFRWYRSGWGRYTQGDPKGLKAGDNLFRYANANPVALVDPLGLAAKKCASGNCPDCPGGVWVSGAAMIERTWKVGPVDVGGIVFSGVFICPSNPYFNVPFTSFCGFSAGPSKPVSTAPSGGGAGAEIAGAGIRCKGYQCREDLQGAEFGGFVQIGPAFGFGEISGSGRGCLGAGVGPGGGLSLGGLTCTTVIGNSLGGRL